MEGTTIGISTGTTAKSISTIMSQQTTDEGGSSMIGERFRNRHNYVAFKSLPFV